MNYVKKLCESTITLKFNKNSKWNSDIDDKLYDISEGEGISINPKDDDTPFAWDAFIADISEGMITLEGYIGPYFTSSSVTIKLPVEKKRLLKTLKIYLIKRCSNDTYFRII